jgi:hypothetical protein
MSHQEDKKKEWSRNSIPKYVFCCSYVSLEITERAPVELSWIPLVDLKLIFASDNYVVGLVDCSQKEQQSWYSSLTFLAVTQRLKKLREVCISDTWDVSDDGALQCVKLLFYFVHRLNYKIIFRKLDSAFVNGQKRGETTENFVVL